MKLDGIFLDVCKTRDFVRDFGLHVQLEVLTYFSLNGMTLSHESIQVTLIKLGLSHHSPTFIVISLHWNA